MDKLEKDNLQFNLNKRLLLFEELNAQIAAAGHTFRRIGALDKRIRESFSAGEIEFPDVLKPSGLRSAVDGEINFQFLHGDPAVGSFMAAMENPRLCLYDQINEIHLQLMAEANQPGK